MSDRSRFRRGDFEARQRQLPADRRARFAKGRAYQRARTDQERTPLGSPPKAVDVRSVWDTRPINAFDFNIAVSALADSITQFAEAFFNVPEGFVCILRNFDLWIDPSPTGSDRQDFKYAIQLNGGDYPYNVDVPCGIQLSRETCFMIANEFNTVGLIVFSDGAGAFDGNETVFVRFYGNFLLKSGLPASLEIGNLVPTVVAPKTSLRESPIRRTPPPPPPFIPPPPPSAQRPLSNDPWWQGRPPPTPRARGRGT